MKDMNRFFSDGCCYPHYVCMHTLKKAKKKLSCCDNSKRLCYYLWVELTKKKNCRESDYFVHNVKIFLINYSMGHDLFGIECGRLLLHVLAVIVSFLFVKKRYIILFFSLLLYCV
jgi:hypothetical protein